MQGGQGGGGQGGAAPQQQSWSSLMLKMLMMYFVFQYFFGARNTKPITDPTSGKVLPPHRNSWNTGQMMVVYFTNISYDLLYLLGYVRVFFRQ
jgi:hypothetical protein